MINECLSAIEISYLSGQIFGFIFGLFIGLFICSILPKRFKNRTPENVKDS